MLLREQRRGAEPRDLASPHHRDEGGPERDFGFPEPDVAADEAIHRFPFLHVVEHRVNRRLLIGGFFKGEAFRERFVVGR